MNNPISTLQIDSTTRLIGRIVSEPPTRIFGNCTLNNVEIGAFSYVSPSCSLHRTCIGRYSSIGNGVQILSIHPVEGLTTSPFPYQTIFRSPFDAVPRVHFDNLEETIIGNDVWIGSGVKLKSGVTVADGAIIGAGSVVTKDIAPYSIVGGVPARLIRHRFPHETIETLVGLAWWQYDLISLDLSWDNVTATINGLIQHINSGTIIPYEPGRYTIFRDGSHIRAKRIDP